MAGHTKFTVSPKHYPYIDTFTLGALRAKLRFHCPIQNLEIDGAFKALNRLVTSPKWWRGEGGYTCKGQTAPALVGVTRFPYAASFKKLGTRTENLSVGLFKIPEYAFP